MQPDLRSFPRLAWSKCWHLNVKVMKPDPKPFSNIWIADRSITDRLHVHVHVSGCENLMSLQVDSLRTLYRIEQVCKPYKQTDFISPDSLLSLPGAMRSFPSQAVNTCEPLLVHYMYQGIDSAKRTCSHGTVMILFIALLTR